MCGAVKGWQVDFDAENNLLSEVASNIESAREGRELLVATADNEIARTMQMLRQLDAAGHPAVENGKKIARDYRQALGSLVPALERFREGVTQLPTDPQSFFQGLKNLNANLGADMDAFGARSKALREEAAASSQLRSALANTPACQKIHT